MVRLPYKPEIVGLLQSGLPDVGVRSFNWTILILFPVDSKSLPWICDIMPFLCFFRILNPEVRDIL